MYIGAYYFCSISYLLIILSIFHYHYKKILLSFCCCVKEISLFVGQQKNTDSDSEPWGTEKLARAKVQLKKHCWFWLLQIELQVSHCHANDKAYRAVYQPSEPSVVPQEHEPGSVACATEGANDMTSLSSTSSDLSDNTDKVRLSESTHTYTLGWIMLIDFTQWSPQVKLILITLMEIKASACQRS